MRTVREDRPHSLLKPWSAGYKQARENMNSFNCVQDCKVEIWRRTPFTIEADTEEEAKKIAASLKDLDLTTDEVINSDVSSKITVWTSEAEYLSETEWNLFPKENGGDCTIEVFSGREVKREKVGDNSVTDKESLMKYALDAFYEARSNYVFLVKARLKEQGGELPVVDCVDRNDKEKSCLVLSRIDDNSMNIEVLLIDAVRLDEHDNLFYHIKERDHEETEEWVEMSFVGTDEMYILQNILWK